MISYKQHRLANGMRVIVGRDHSSKLAAVNLLYCVGARNENPQHTGFAHLFEHLMFKGTERFPSFDYVVQSASGENNAFTNNDYTDYYITLPKLSIAEALELEADRMRNLQITPQALESEKRVVIEEYKQRYLNQPYGDLMMLVRDMCYKVHPYRWATIGLSNDHIQGATMEQVRSFYDKFYRPSNAILSVVADVDEQELFEMCNSSFGAIEDIPINKEPLPVEPMQREARRMEVERDVPATYVVIAFPMGERLSDDFYRADLASDLLAGGDSGRLYQRLVKGEGILSSVNAYITGDVDAGLFLFTAQLLPESTVEQAEAALWREIEELKNLTEDQHTLYELEKVKNKFEASTLFGEINVMNKAMNMGYYSMIGDLPLINKEVDIFRSLKVDDIRQFAQKTFATEHSNTLIYRAKKQ